MQEKTKKDLLDSPVVSLSNVQYQEGDVFMQGDFKLKSGLLLHGTVCRDAYTFTVDKNCELSQEIREISWTYCPSFYGNGISVDIAFSKGLTMAERLEYRDILKPKTDERYTYPFPPRFTYIPLLKRAIKIDCDMYRVRENKRKVISSRIRLEKSIQEVKESLNLQKERID